MKILRGAKRLPGVKNNETITKILRKSRFWLCNRNETVYTNYITGSKEASEARPEARFDRFDSLFIGDCRRCTSNSYFYRRMCGAGAVRGWAAFRTVSFLTRISINSLQEHPAADALFLCPHVGAPTRELREPGEGRMGRCAHLYRAAAVLLCRIVPIWLSTGVIHSVENLHDCY